jgi:hypothetical protein
VFQDGRFNLFEQLLDILEDIRIGYWEGLEEELQPVREESVQYLKA